MAYMVATGGTQEQKERFLLLVPVGGFQCQGYGVIQGDAALLSIAHHPRQLVFPLISFPATNSRQLALRRRMKRTTSGPKVKLLYTINQARVVTDPNG